MHTDISVPEPPRDQIHRNKVNTIRVSLLRGIDVADIGFVICTRYTRQANGDIAIAGNVATGQESNRNIIVANKIVKQCVDTDCCIIGACSVVVQRSITVCCVGAAVDVAI